LVSPKIHGQGISRRKLLRWIVASSVLGGVGVILSSYDVGVSGQAPSATSKEISVQEPPVSSPIRPPPTRVKVVYFQMEQSLDTSQEYFQMGSPAYLPDLLPLVTKKHPSLAPMLPMMQILIDGVSAQGMTALSDGSEVDFIPVFGGG
jgi:hypothetical protein